MFLVDLNPGEKALIYKIHGSGAFKKRLIEMGLIKGKEIEVIKKAPLQDPIQYEVMGYQVSLRRDEAAKIEIIGTGKNLELFRIPEVNFNDFFEEEIIERTEQVNKGKTINIVFVGNPNSGKTSIFNFISGARENVGNYPGVTVDAKKAKFKYRDFTFNLIDLPGTYSITAYTPEEMFVRQFVTSEKTDIVINVVDCSNLERNLYLTTQLLDLDMKMLIALNMYDELQSIGTSLNYEKLASMIGVPMVPTVGKKGDGMKELLDKCIQIYENTDPIVRHIHINYGTAIEESVEKLERKIEQSNLFPKHIHTRFIALKLLEKDGLFMGLISNAPNMESFKTLVFNEIEKLETLYQEETGIVFADIRYGFIAGALKETSLRITSENKKYKSSEQLDKIFTHRIWGLPIFLFVLWLMFFSTFYLGGIVTAWIEKFVELVGKVCITIIPQGIVQDMFVEGIVGGVGGVIVFLPNIIILFLFIAFLEGTGYMARIAFIMDRLMHKIGLHGKSFIPLVMGFGCNVPAIMATRTLENKSDRILTMLIIPLMSCSARLPVYLLLIGAFFSSHAALVLMILYFSGVIFASMFALIFKKLFFNKIEAPFVMELPPYRMPTFRAIYTYMWLRASQYLRKMGGIILIASLIIWILSTFPRKTEFSKDYNVLANEIKLKYELLEQNAGEDIQTEKIKSEKLALLTELVSEREAERHSATFIGQLGKITQPIMQPLGLDWRLTISLLSGFPAKEVILSTMGVLFQEYELDSTQPDINKFSVKVVPLGERIKNAFLHTDEGSKPLFTPVNAFAFLIFVLFYFPCTASIVAIKKESERWLWTTLSIIYTTCFAWLMAFLVNQFGGLFF